jgi:hypothetical protein
VYQTDPRNETGEKREVIELFIHSLYNDTSLVADLCLLKVCEKINFFEQFIPLKLFICLNLLNLVKNSKQVLLLLLYYGKSNNAN